MNFLSPAKRLLCVFGLGVMLSACNGNMATAENWPDNYYLQMKGKCGTCHNKNSTAAKVFIIEATPADTYTNLTSKQLLNTASPAMSRLTVVGAGGMYTPFAGGPMVAHPSNVLDADTRAKWEAWIGLGAPQ